MQSVKKEAVPVIVARDRKKLQKRNAASENENWSNWKTVIRPAFLVY
jgi:hypothetical protein